MTTGLVSEPSFDAGRLNRLRFGAVARIAPWVLALSLVWGAAPATAASYTCVGKVDQVAVEPGGMVNAGFAFQTGAMNWQTICNLEFSAHNVGVASCKAILATLLSARMSGQTVQVWFDNATPGQCSATSWRPLRDMGWYYGPSVTQ